MQHVRTVYFVKIGRLEIFNFSLLNSLIDSGNSTKIPIQKRIIDIVPGPNAAPLSNLGIRIIPTAISVIVCGVAFKKFLENSLINWN